MAVRSRRLPLRAVQLSLVRQSSLSQVSRSADGALAGKAAATIITLCLLLLDLHLALGTARAGLCPSESSLWFAAQQRGRGHPKNLAFLVPGFALGKIFKGKFKAGLKKLGLLNQVPAALWQQNPPSPGASARPGWNVQIQHAGRGQKVLEYLGRYAFRIAISNSRLEKFENGQVTFAYRDHKTQELKHLTLPAQEFIRRFLRHVLPKGFVKVRSYGLVSSTQKEKLEKARTLLATAQPEVTLSTELLPHRALDLAPRPPAAQLCPHCKIGHLVLVASLLPQRTRGP